MRTVHREIVSALIFSKDGRLLMGMKDPADGGVYADCWHIPGGGVDEGETQLEALRREILEEVGIDIGSCKVALADDKGTGETEKTLKDTGEKVLCKMQFNVYRVDVNKNAAEIETKLSDDLVKLEWVALTQLSDYRLTPPSVALFERLELGVQSNVNQMPVITIHLPQYRVDTEPDYKAIGKIVDDELRKHFIGQNLVVRGIGSSEHPDKTVDELIEIIKQSGTDRYDPNRQGDRYENIKDKHIDLFAFRRKITSRTELFRWVAYGFYRSAIGVHGKPTRIDVLIIYDAAKLRAVLHQYEGRDDKKRDGFVFRDQANKRQALLGIVKID
jgi:8-oxo-dGTP pyrophosphatase MutT (NUDIX family)